MLRARFATAGRQHLLPLLACAGLALLIIAPVLGHATEYALGRDRDIWQNMWNLWWLKSALREGANPFHTSAIYYPSGVSLLLHTLNPLSFIISLPVHAAFGLIAAYNWIIFFWLVVAGYAAYLLAAHLTGRRWPALVAGLLFEGTAFTTAQIAGGHMNLVASGLVALALLAMLRIEERPTWRRVAALALVLGLTALTDWYLFLYSGMFGALRLGALLWRHRALRPLLPTLAGLAAGALLALPLLVPTMLLARSTPNLEQQSSLEFQIAHSADLRDFVTPSQLHPQFGPQAAQAQDYKANIDIQNKVAYLGLVALALALLGLRAAPRWWAACALIWLVLALGPELQFAGWRTGVPLPGRILAELPFFNIARFPIRYAVLAALCLAVLAAYGLIELQRWFPRWRTLVPALALALLLFDQAARVPTVSIYVPDIYRQIGAEQGDFAVLEGPFARRYSAIFMFYQTIHGKDLVGGYTSREMPYDLPERFPTIRMFQTAQPVIDIIDEDRPAIARSLFSTLNIRYITLHGQAGGLRSDQVRAVAEAAAGTDEPQRVITKYEEDREAVFFLYPVRAPERPLPFLGLHDGWGPPLPLDENSVTRQISSSAELGIYAPAGQQLTLEIALRADASSACQLELTTPDGTSVYDVASIGTSLALPLTPTEALTPVTLRTSCSMKVSRLAIRPAP